MSDVAAGWYNDPTGALQQRYWDGAAWTERTQPFPPPQAMPSASAALKGNRQTFTGPRPTRKEEALWTQISQSDLRRAKRYLATNASAEPALLRWLSHDDDADVREAVAANRATPSDALASLVNDAVEVRLALAENHAAPPDVLSSLLDDDWDVIWYAVARNPNAPDEALAKMARMPYLRIDLLGNPSLPSELRAALLMTADEETLNEYGRVPPLREPMSDANLSAFRKGKTSWQPTEVAMNPEAPASWLRHIAQQHPSARMLVAGNPAADTDTLKRLSEDPDLSIRVAVAGNPSTPSSILFRMLARPDTAAVVLGNPKAPRGVISAAAKDLLPEELVSLSDPVAHLPNDAHSGEIVVEVPVEGLSFATTGIAPGLYRVSECEWELTRDGTVIDRSLATSECWSLVNITGTEVLEVIDAWPGIDGSDPSVRLIPLKLMPTVPFFEGMETGRYLVDADLPMGTYELVWDRSAPRCFYCVLDSELQVKESRDLQGDGDRIMIDLQPGHFALEFAGLLRRLS